MGTSTLLFFLFSLLFRTAFMSLLPFHISNARDGNNGGESTEHFRTSPCHQIGESVRIDDDDAAAWLAS